MKSKYITLLVIGILNYFVLIPNNIVILTLSLIVSILLLKNFNNKNFVFSLIVFLCWFALSLISLKTDFDKNLFTMGHLESHKTVARHGYYVKEFGQIYANRFGLFYSDSIRPVVSKFTRNSFSHLEFNQYFLGNNLISVIFLLLFFIGFYIFILKPSTLTVFYFSISFFIGGFLIDSSKFAVSLFVPIINLFVCLGFLGLFNIFKNGEFKIK